MGSTNIDVRKVGNNMEQQKLNLNQELAHLMKNGKWKACQRKRYSVHAIVPPAGFVFANRLEQPKSFKHITNKFGRYIVQAEELTDADKALLGSEYYVTDGSKVVVCGTCGELWTVKPEKFAASYTEEDGSVPKEVPAVWKEYWRAEETEPSAKGVQIPVEYLATYKADWGELRMNDLESPGHYKGDILVVSNDGQSISPINNMVFAFTFDQNVGGWALSDEVVDVDEEKIQPMTTRDVCYTYVFSADSRPVLSLLDIIAF